MMWKVGRLSKGFTLTEWLAVIAVIGILVLAIFCSLRARMSGQKARAKEAVADSSGAYDAYQLIAAILLASHPQLVSSDNWWTIATSHGYDLSRDPREHQGRRVANLHFRPWVEIEDAKLPAAKTVWAYEVFSSLYGGPFQPGTPCLFQTIEVEVPRRGIPPYAIRHEKRCLVIFADGRVEQVGVEDLRRLLGIIDERVEPVVWTGGYRYQWITWSEWQEQQATRKR